MSQHLPDESAILGIELGKVMSENALLKIEIADLKSEMNRMKQLIRSHLISTQSFAKRVGVSD